MSAFGSGATLGVLDDAGHEECEVGKTAAVEGDVLDLRGDDDIAVGGAALGV